jgi:ISXO2-like transposase domain
VADRRRRTALAGASRRRTGPTSRDAQRTASIALAGYFVGCFNSFSLIKRGITGTFHSVSRKHLPNYLNEFEFRWNTRKLEDGLRVARAIRRVDGKRLTYRESVDNPPYLVPKAATQPNAPFGAKE